MSGAIVISLKYDMQPRSIEESKHDRRDVEPRYNPPGILLWASGLIMRFGRYD